MTFERPRAAPGRDEEARALLREARDELRKHWFIVTDEDEFNDDDVISLTHKIDGFLARSEGPPTPTG